MWPVLSWAVTSNQTHISIMKCINSNTKWNDEDFK